MNTAEPLRIQEQGLEDSALIGGGMNWSRSVLTIFPGNLIVLLPMLLNTHAGTRYGIPFLVLCQASFGTRGANVPALLHALVAYAFTAYLVFRKMNFHANAHAPTV